MTEAKLEKILADQISALGIEGLTLDLSLGTPAEEDGGELAVLTISTDNRSQAYWEIPQYDVSASLQLETRIELDPDRSKHMAIVDKLTDLLASWSARGGSAAYGTAFAIEGEFTPAYFMTGGGNNLTDRDNGVYIWSQAVTFRGIIHPSTTPQGE